MRYRRAVSDLVSFTLVFSTVVFLIGAITITGITTLNDVQDGTETNVAEATMRSFASTLTDHRVDGAPSRSTTIKLQGHNFRRVGSSMAVSVTSGATVTDLSIETGAIVRTTDTDTQLIYESGGVFRVADSGGLVVVRRPQVRCTTNSAHLPITSVRGGPNITADGRITMRTELEDQRLLYPNASQNTRATSLTLDTTEMTVPEAWQQVLDSSGGWSPVGPSDPGVYECSVDRVVVHETVIEVDAVT